jgi:hypothetical protein
MGIKEEYSRLIDSLGKLSQDLRRISEMKPNALEPVL